MPDDAQTFLNDIQSEVEDRATGADGTAPDFKENVFTEYVMEMLASDVGSFESSEACHFYKDLGGNRGHAKINGYAIGEDAQDEESIALFVTVYKGYASITRVPAEEMRKAAEQAVRYFTSALGKLFEQLDPAQPQYQMAKRIHDSKSKLKSARLFILTDGQSDLSQKKSYSTSIKDTAVQLRVEFWDIERLSRVLGSGSPHSEIEIDFVELNGAPLQCISSGVTEDDYSAYVTIIPGQLLFQMYEDHGAALLQRNVRSFLQAKGKVNRGIRDSIKQQPGRFLAYNNGISLTADSVEKVENGPVVSITRIKGLQIVNGGQTTASIHRAAKFDKFDLSRVFVPAKLTVLKPDLIDTLAPKIAEYANTQNPVQMADFSANDPYHIEFEKLSNSIWSPDGQARWFYERTRGQYNVELNKCGKGTAKEKRFKETTPKHRKLGKIELAKFLNAWDQLPHQVSHGGQKNFVMFTQRMRESRSKTWKPDECYFKEAIAKAILFDRVDKMVIGTRYKPIKPLVVAYVVASAAFKTSNQFDLMQVWQQQRISIQLEEMLSQWIPLIGEEILETAHGRHLSEWCKKPECWKTIQRLSLPFPKAAPSEMQKIERSGGSWGVVPTEARVALDADELDARQRCRQMEPTDWIRIIQWGTNSGMLDNRQREIASEIASLAASGWNKDIITRKAIAGREIINLAMDNGVLLDAAVS
jgi:hypothetical protein